MIPERHVEEAWGHLSDAIFCLREGLAEMVTQTDEARLCRDHLFALRAALIKLEREYEQVLARVTEDLEGG